MRTMGGVITDFESHDQAERWIAGHGTYRIGRIDDHFSIFLDPGSGRATVELNCDPDLTFHSETQVPTVDGGQVRLLQGLSFDFEYGTRFTFDYRTQNPPQPYSWQRNIMSYRYAREIDSNPDTRREEIDPYDYLTARFSQSQIELMQRQLAGSTPFVVSIHGIRPPGTWDLFASQDQLLGDGGTEDFVWYSNGEGPADVDAGDDLPDRIAFRMAPAGSVGLDTAANLVAGDFNGDGLTDLLWHDAQRPSTLLWSRVEPEEGTPGVHQWDEEPLAASALAGYSTVFAGDFDGNGADDLFLARPGENTATVVHFRSDPSCRSFATCQSQTTTAQVGGIEGPVAVGNFDGRNGDDFLWASVSGGTTVAYVYWSNADGSFTADTATDVGGAEYIPYAGNFNGTGGDEVLWYDPSAGNEVLWWGAGGEAGDEHRMLCGPGGSSDCIDVSWNVISASPRLTIGDFDGNGADDILIQDTHEPFICFSSQGSQTVYAGSYTVLQVALRSSRDYLAAVGEFDGASDDSGRLGEDVFLYYRPIAP